jgi:hypothetical protein
MAKATFPLARRGIGEVSRLGSPIETGEEITAIQPPANQKSYGYKSSRGEPKAVSDSLASAPVSMAPKRQVRARGEAPSASAETISTPVSMPPKIRKSPTGTRMG